MIYELWDRWKDTLQFKATLLMIKDTLIWLAIVTAFAFFVYWLAVYTLPYFLPHTPLVPAIIVVTSILIVIGMVFHLILVTLIGVWKDYYERLEQSQQ